MADTSNFCIPCESAPEYCAAPHTCGKKPNPTQRFPFGPDRCEHHGRKWRKLCDRCQRVVRFERGEHRG